MPVTALRPLPLFRGEVRRGAESIDARQGQKTKRKGRVYPYPRAPAPWFATINHCLIRAGLLKSWYARIIPIAIAIIYFGSEMTCPYSHSHAHLH